MKEKISYKLIKNYKDCPEIGSIESYDGGTISTPIWRGTNYYKSHSEYWQKVEEKEYEIVNYIITDGVFKDIIVNELVKRAMVGFFKTYEINSIKRLSDNEIFTIGEKVKRVNSFGETFKIKHFVEENNGKLWVGYGDENYGGGTYFENIKKIKEIKYPIINKFCSTKYKDNFYFYNNGLYSWVLDHSNQISLYNMINLEPCVDSGNYYINEVVISETVTLKIGDTIIFSDEKCLNPKPFIIDNFYYCIDDVILCRSKDNLVVEDVMTVKIYEEPKISFVTEDGVTVFENDNVYWVTIHSGDNFWTYLYCLGLCEDHKDMLDEANSHFKIFSSKYSAELFILKEKMLSSFKEYNEDFSKYQNKLKEEK